MQIFINKNTLDVVLHLIDVELFFPTSGFGDNEIIFRADTSSAVHVDNKKKYILILGEGLNKD